MELFSSSEPLGFRIGLDNVGQGVSIPQHAIDRNFTREGPFKKLGFERDIYLQFIKRNVLFCK